MTAPDWSSASPATAGGFWTAAGGFNAGPGSSRRADPIATTPIDTSAAAATTAVATSISRVTDRLLRMPAARAATVTGAVPPIAAATAARATPPGPPPSSRLRTSTGRPRPPRRDAPAGQPLAQPMPGLDQPVPQRRLGPVQAAGGLLVGQALQVAEDHRQPLAIGQPVELLVHDGSDLGVGIGAAWDASSVAMAIASASRRRRSLGIASSVHGGAVGDAVQPAAQGVAGADRSGLTCQDEEGGLEGVLDVVLVPEDGAAGGQDHGAMAGDQGLEGGLVAVGDIPGQELAIAESDRAAVVEQVAEVPQGAPQYADGHDANPRECPARRGRCPSPLAPLVKG